MTRYSSGQLLTPPREEEEVYPYRRVWPSLFQELGGVLLVTMVLYVAGAFLGIRIPELVRQPLNIILAVLPGILWMLFSRIRERSVPQPRQGLLGVFVITVLAANAIGTPILQTIAPGEWLSLSGSTDRILGYMVTVGITQETIKYLVIRYVVWSDRFRERLDAIAYSTSAAYGYVIVINLRFVLAESLEPDVVAVRVFSNTVIHISAGIIVAYGLADARFNPRSLFLLPSTLILASAIHGIGITARSGLANAGFFLGIAGARPMLAFMISALFAGLILVVAAFLFNNVERQERQARESREL